MASEGHDAGCMYPQFDCTCVAICGKCKEREFKLHIKDGMCPVCWDANNIQVIGRAKKARRRNARNRGHSNT